MSLKLSVMCLLMALLLFVSAGIVSAKVQTFESDIGTVQIDLPCTVELSSSSSGSSLYLNKQGTTKPIISIIMEDAAMYKDLQDFAASFIGEGHDLEKMTTGDGRPMLFNSYRDGTDRDGNPTYTFRAFIDYANEKGKYIILHAPNDVRYQGDTITTYTADQFAAICRSLTIK